MTDPEDAPFIRRHYWKIGWVIGAWMVTLAFVSVYDAVVVDILPNLVVSFLPHLGIVPLILWGMGGAFPGKVMRS